jgi:hypothetical protein
MLRRASEVKEGTVEHARFGLWPDAPPRRLVGDLGSLGATSAGLPVTDAD